MKILHVYKDYYPVLGGIENHVRLLARRQAAAGHDVTALVTSRGPRTAVEEIEGVRVIKAARLAHVASTPLSLSLPWHLARQRPDIAQIHFPYPVGEVAHLLLGQSHATVVSYHSDVVRQQQILRFYRPLMMRFLRSADRILVASPNYLESSDVLQQVRARCVVLPYGIDRETFISGGGTESQALRARLGGGPIILFVGVLRYYKGVNYLIRAMANVDATLVVAGAGPMEAEWRALVRDLGLDARVHFAGRVPDEQLPSYYHAADIFCLPASERSEAFGLVQVEAMSSGLPIVSTDLGTGTSYVNMHGESGLVVPPRDPAALAAALNQLLADRMLCQELARGALQRSALFDVERMYRDVQQVYEELL